MWPIEVYSYRLRYKQPITTAWGKLLIREGLLLKLDLGAAGIAWGECAPLDHFNRETKGQCLQILSMIHNKLCQFSLPANRYGLDAQIHALLDINQYPSLYYAIETLFFDAASRLNNQALNTWLNPAARSSVYLNALLSGDKTAIQTRLNDLVRQGYSTFKLKLHESVADAISKIAWLRGALGADYTIRVDANQAYDYADALTLLKAIAPYNIAYVEEPLQQFNQAHCKQLQQESGVALAVDESLACFDIKTVLKAACCQYLILKPMVLGGITRCISITEQALKQNIACVITSSLESPVSIMASLHLASGLPEQKHLAHGLLLMDFEEMDYLPCQVTNGQYHLQAHKGLGVNQLPINHCQRVL